MVGFIALLSWGISQIEEKPRFAEPKVIAKYEPKPWYPDKKVTEEVKERAEYQVIERITQ